jgi:hypothetical protein
VYSRPPPSHSQLHGHLERQWGSPELAGDVQALVRQVRVVRFRCLPGASGPFAHTACHVAPTAPMRRAPRTSARACPELLLCSCATMTPPLLRRARAVADRANQALLPL